MECAERFQRVDQPLHEQQVVPLRTIRNAPRVSRATFERGRKFLRDCLHPPTVRDRERAGCRCAPARNVSAHGSVRESVADGHVFSGKRIRRARVIDAQLAAAWRNA
jgi:hypothetical protein